MIIVCDECKGELANAGGGFMVCTELDCPTSGFISVLIVDETPDTEECIPFELQSTEECIDCNDSNAQIAISNHMSANTDILINDGERRQNCE